MWRAKREHVEEGPQESAEMMLESVDYPDAPVRPSRWAEFKRLWLLTYRREGMQGQFIVLGVLFVLGLIYSAIFE